MKWPELKRDLQEHFTDGLAIIVGSGLSAAEGLPGMPELARHLLEQVPVHLGDLSSAWLAIESDLKAGMDLESVLLKTQPDRALESIINQVTGQLVVQAETALLDRVFSGRATLRFTRLVEHLLKPNTGIPIMTTNYDRLIEVAVELAGIKVNTLFVGDYVGGFSPSESQYSLCRGVTQRRKVVHLSFAEHALVLKPHGSLDWYVRDGEPIRSPLELSLPRLIITPGVNKFRGGYERPFDAHRERANREIDAASRFLIVGYGFNDDHLQTHLERQLKRGQPAILLGRAFSPKVVALIKECPGTYAICEGGSPSSSKIYRVDSTLDVPGANLWDLGGFIDEVLKT